MIWDDPAFRDDYRARLRHVQASGEAEVRAQGQAFQVESALAGGSSGEVFTRRAGAAAAATLSGYVRGALDAFDQTLAAAEAELDESALNGLRASLEQEIARRAKSLPAVLREFSKTAAPPALMRAVVEQAPRKARELLRDRLATARDQIRTHARAREVLDRAIFISHNVLDVALADALKLAIAAAVGGDVPVCTSSDLAGHPSARDGSEHVLARLKKNRMTLSLVTRHSIGDPSLWWTLGLAEGAGRPALIARSFALSLDAGPPIPADRVFDLARRDDVVRLLQAIQSELRRRTRDLAELDLDDVLREMEGSRSS
jgi:hypothetical protein